MKKRTTKFIVITMIAALMLTMMPLTVSAASNNPGKAKITSIKAGKVSKKTNTATVTVKWNKVKKASGYEVYVKHTLDSKWTKVKTTGKLKKSCKIKKVRAGRYYVKVRAIRTVNGAVYKGKFSAKKNVFIKSKLSLKKSFYKNVGNARVNEFISEIKDEGGKLSFKGNKMIITLYADDEDIADYVFSSAEKKQVKAELQKDKDTVKDMKDISKWLKNATGVSNAKVVLSLHNNVGHICSLTY